MANSFFALFFVCSIQICLSQNKLSVPVKNEAKNQNEDINKDEKLLNKANLSIVDSMSLRDLKDNKFASEVDQKWFKEHA